MSKQPATQVLVENTSLGDAEARWDGSNALWEIGYPWGDTQAEDDAPAPRQPPMNATADTALRTLCGMGVTHDALSCETTDRCSRCRRSYISGAGILWCDVAGAKKSHAVLPARVPA